MDTWGYLGYGHNPRPPQGILGCLEIQGAQGFRPNLLLLKGIWLYPEHTLSAPWFFSKDKSKHP